MLWLVGLWRDGAMHRLFSVIVGVLVAAVAGAEEKPADPYIVTIDVRPWIEQLRSDDLFEIDPAIESLGALGDYAVPALHAALEAEGPQARLNIVEILRDIRTPATAPPLIDAANDQDEEVRAAAIEALGRLGDERGRPAVEAALLGDSPAAVRAAAIACAKLCASPAALRRLVEMSLAEKTSFARPSLRAAAAGGHAAQVRALVAEIAAPAMREGPADQRYRAAMVVAESGDATAVPVLEECIRQPADSPQAGLRVLCLQALGASASEQSIGTLSEIAGGPDPTLRPIACAALGAFVQKSDAARQAYASCARKVGVDPAQLPSSQRGEFPDGISEP